MVDAVLAGGEGRRVMVLAPIIEGQRGGHKSIMERMIREGFVRARVDGEVVLFEELGALPANRRHTIEIVVDRVVTKPDVGQRLAESIETAARLARGRVVVTAQSDEGAWVDKAYSTTLACPDHPDVRIEEPTPQSLSFNTPQGACPTCHGLGVAMTFDPELIVPDPKRSLNDGAIQAWRHQGRRLSATYADMIRTFCERFRVPPDMPFENLPEHIHRILMHGTNDEDEAQYGISFEGVLPNLQRRWSTTESDSAKEKLRAFLDESRCSSCNGSRMSLEARAIKIKNQSLADVSSLTIDRARDFLDEVSFDGESAIVAEPLLRELRERLTFLCDVGVEYLTLDRATATLSGGEFQRIRLATQIGSGLSGVCYVLDEPTIGLHPRDTQRLTQILRRLADLDNTVIVVEHEEQVIRGADHLIDVGPGAGAHGGTILVHGAIDDVLACDTSITAKYLSGELRVPEPTKRRDINWDRSITLHGVTANNLKNLTVRFPLACWVAVTGVSGSGKSTLVSDVLLRALRRRITRGGPKPGSFECLSDASLVDKVVEVDQSPIGRTPRSNPATYVGVLNLIRDLYAKTREAKIRGYGPARFSFNIAGGRCEQCEGQGTKRITMHFLPDVFVTCTACNGARYNRETLEIRYRGRTIADVLDMSIEDALTFFDNFNNIKRRLQALCDVGLGYMKLGQASNTLSGGEAQRVKLAGELHKSGDGHTMYILDEPTTGLHPHDVRNLLTILNRLVDRGQTVLVIEHDPDVISQADWVIDLGPDGGEAGGHIVVEGRLEQIIACDTSHTGQ